MGLALSQSGRLVFPAPRLRTSPRPRRVTRDGVSGKPPHESNMTNQDLYASLREVTGSVSHALDLDLDNSNALKSDWTVRLEGGTSDSEARFCVTAVAFVPFPETGPHQTARLAQLAGLPNSTHTVDHEIALLHEEHFVLPVMYNPDGSPNYQQLAQDAVHRGRATMRTIGNSWERVLRTPHAIGEY